MKYLSILISFFFQIEKEPPPGTMLVKGYYVDKTEILNIHYLEFLHYMKPRMENPDNYYMLFPDSVNFWYDVPSKRHQPVVHISWEQAMLYCEWRTAIVRERLNLKVTYRLMTPEEWAEIGEEILKTAPEHIEKERKKTQKVMARKGDSYFYLKEITNPMNKMYHYFDNVSEMTLTKGVAMGDNNIDMSEEVETNLTRLINYTQPNPFLGFRCIAEFEE